MKKYIKRGAGEFKTTSVTIRREQYEFIKENNINMSAVLQDALKKLMRSKGGAE